jgi:large subunit ribosomal protein L7/L12
MAEKFDDIIKKIEGLTALELSELVKALEEKFGVSAAMPASTAAAGAGEGGSAATEKTSFDVILKSAGEQKINLIKAVKEVAGLGLKEAKDLVEGAPKPIKQGLKKAEAEEIKAKLEAVGATVELQ